MEGIASRRVIEFEIVLYIWAPPGESASPFTVNRSVWRTSAGARNMEKCENQSLLLMILAETPEEGDVIHRRSTRWPACRLEGTRLRIIDSRAALKCWWSTTCFCRAPPPDTTHTPALHTHAHSLPPPLILPDCWLCMWRRRLLTRGGIFQGSSDSVTVSSESKTTSERAVLCVCVCVCVSTSGLGGVQWSLIICLLLLNIFLVSCLQTRLRLLSALRYAAIALHGEIRITFGIKI